ncbi:MAG TPA: hypothetical protein VMR43_13250, partial [Variovorax sp.]|nr:hypothetical protein [Variovorax sp.]
LAVTERGNGFHDVFPIERMGYNDAPSRYDYPIVATLIASRLNVGNTFADFDCLLCPAAVIHC